MWDRPCVQQLHSMFPSFLHSPHLFSPVRGSWQLTYQPTRNQFTLTNQQHGNAADQTSIKFMPVCICQISVRIYMHLN